MSTSSEDLPAARPEGDLGSDEISPWGAWVDEEPFDQAEQAAELALLESRLTRHDVTAVIVAHDGARWLPFCLAALADLERPPRRVVAVDTGSSDATTQVLSESLGSASVLDLPRGTGFGAAVAHAVTALAGAPGLPSADAQAPIIEWLWLLHDDCAPEPKALRALLVAAELVPTAGVIGPKVRGWKDGRLLLELGVSIGRGGRRETYLETGETDQGQHDQRRDVLAVGSAGMLVRRDVWDDLGGFASDLPLFRDDLDFGWRARRAGYRVVVAPEAVVHHAEAAAHGRRVPEAAGGSVHRADRRSALLVLLGNLPVKALPWAVLRLTLGSVVRALALLVGKAPREAADELGAWASVIGRPDRVRRARRMRSGSLTEPWDSVRPFLAPTGLHLRHGFEALVGAAGSGVAVTSGAGSAVESGPIGDESEAMGLPGGGLVSRALHRPATWLGLGLLLTTVLAWRGLVFGSSLQGGALLPAPPGASDLWRSFAEPWHSVGVGSSLDAPPWIAATAAASVATLGRPGALVSLLFLSAVPLAGLSAYALLRRLTGSRRLRLWGSAGYALLPAVTGSVAAGRLGTTVVAWLLPLLVLAGWRLRPSPSVVMTWRSVGGTGLLLALAMAFVPLIWVAGVLAALGLGLLGSAPRSWWVRAGAVLAIPWVVLLPWSWGLVQHPSTLLLEAGAVGTGLSDPALPTWAVALASPGGPGIPAYWVTVGLVVAAVVALLVGRRRRVVAIAWLGVLIGLLLGMLALVVRVPVPALEMSVTPWPGLASLVVGGGLVVASVVGAEGLQSALGRQAFGWRQPVAVIVVAVAVLVPVAAAVSWIGRGAGGPLTRLPASVLPAFVVASSATPSQPSTLVLEGGAAGTPVTYALQRGQGATLGDADVAPAATSAGPLGLLVEEMASGGAGDDVAGRLATYGAGFVLLVAPADPELARALDSAPGLERLASTDGSALWGVSGAPSRLRVQSADGESVVVPAGPVDAEAPIASAVPGFGGSVPDRVLALADTADSRWRATLDGAPLTPLGADTPPVSEPPVPAYSGDTATWAQRFALPATGGAMSLTYDGATRTRWLITEGLLVAGVVVLALPSRRREAEEDDDDPTPSPGSTKPASEPLRTSGAAA